MSRALPNPAARALAARQARRDGPGSRAAPKPGTLPHPFRTAMEARDTDRVVATLREDVVAYSPVTPRPFVGIRDVASSRT